ncbi:MAG: HAMP domain-containing sensor histidine kinase, partial [Lentisphaeria bacterium]
ASDRLVPTSPVTRFTVSVAPRMSDTIAGSSVEQLEKIESLKGGIFVVATSLLMYAIIYCLVRRLRKHEMEIGKHRRALVASEQRAAAGVMAASMAHDIGNVLTVTELAGEELAEETLTPEQRQQALKNIEQGNKRMRGLTRRLMDVGKQGIPGEITDFDLRTSVQQALKFVRSHRSVKRCKLVTGLNQAVPFRGNSAMLQQLIINLVLNAADAADKGGIVKVTLDKNDHEARLVVEDSGEGITPDKKDLVFDTFYTTKEEGNGLGLLTVKACVAEHGGKVEIGDSELGGALFKVTLPLHS